jgi:hypothetical protein
MKYRAALAVHELEEIEERYAVSFVARGGAYGSAHLYIVDRRTGEEIPVSEVLPVKETSK